MLAIAAFPGAVSSEERCDSAAPLRIANLSPFHIPYRVHASFGACVLPPGASELIAALDIASHLGTASSTSERLSIDGETWRPFLAVRRGFAEGWEYWFELSAVSHNRGVFDGFIETWQDVFRLPQGGRDTAPGDRLAIAYARKGTARVDIDRTTASPGDIALGVGRAVEFSWTDGLALRARATLPTGDHDALAGARGLSATVWAETSGRLFGPRGSRLALERDAGRARDDPAASAGERPEVGCLRPAGPDLAAVARPRPTVALDGRNDFGDDRVSGAGAMSEDWAAAGTRRPSLVAGRCTNPVTLYVFQHLMIDALHLPRVPRSAERGGEPGAERSPAPFQIRGFVRKEGVGQPIGNNRSYPVP